MNSGDDNDDDPHRPREIPLIRLNRSIITSNSRQGSRDRRGEITKPRPTPLSPALSLGRWGSSSLFVSSRPCPASGGRSLPPLRVSEPSLPDPVCVSKHYPSSGASDGGGIKADISLRQPFAHLHPLLAPPPVLQPQRGVVPREEGEGGRKAVEVIYPTEQG
jgi:hypothetical protein